MARDLRSPLHQKMIDDAISAYVEWREECLAVWEAYDRSSGAGYKDALRAHAAYRAALDREEAAANTYAEVIGRTAELLPDLK